MDVSAGWGRGQEIQALRGGETVGGQSILVEDALVRI